MFRRSRNPDLQSHLNRSTRVNCKRGHISEKSSELVQVTHKEIIRFRTKTSNLEQLYKIEKLAMDITANLLKCAKVNQRIVLIENTALTVTGESTTCTLPSSIKISRAFKQSLLTCSSDIGSHRISCAICLEISVKKVFFNK